MEILNRFDLQLNKASTTEIGIGSTVEYYFKCPRDIHDSYLCSPQKVVKNYNAGSKILICKKCASFAQWGLDTLGCDFLEKYWDYTKNNEVGLDPWDMSRKTSKKAWIKCQKNKDHPSTFVSCAHFVNGHRCIYCTHQKTLPTDSFAAYYTDIYGPDFLAKYWNVQNTVSPFEIPPKGWSNKILINCQKNSKHIYWVKSANFSVGTRCPYCIQHKVMHEESLGANCDVESIWSSKNYNTPYEYAVHSGKAVFWKCENKKHEDYKRTIYKSFSSGFRCPLCVNERNESFLQEKVRLYLRETLGYEVRHEHFCSIVPKNPKTMHAMPFDNEVVDLKLIIETHGEQHYRLNKYSLAWSKGLNVEQALHKRKLYDRYKKLVAIRNGYFYVEIPFWADDAAESYKQIIDNKISEILHKTVVEAVVM